MCKSDEERLELIATCCRDIYYYMQRNGTYDSFAADEACLRTVSERLCSLSEISCGLSADALDKLERRGFRAGYLHSLRLWVRDAEAGGERYRRAVWEIISRDCVPLLLACTQIISPD